MVKILNEEIIKYEISKRNPEYTEIVNIHLYYIIESLIRGILLFSKELIKKDKAKFYEYFYLFGSIEAHLQKINKKLYLFNKEIFNIRTIIKIEEAYKYNEDQFENNYDRWIDNLLEQTIFLYNENYNNLYNKIIELNKIFDQTFEKKTEEYTNLLFYLFRLQYKNIYDEDIRIKLIENFFENKSLIKHCKIFLAETLKDLKPQQLAKKVTEETLEKNFLNLDKNTKLSKYRNLIDIYNKINSEEFNEVLLFFLEGQCQSYFESILNRHKNIYNEDSCKELILKVSLKYLKKSIEYLYEHQNNNDNNLLKLYSIAYLKTYFHYYVEINYNHSQKVGFEEINKLLQGGNELNQKVVDVRNIYIWRVYFKQFENFEKFVAFDFEKKTNFPLIAELKNILIKEEKEKAKNNNGEKKEDYIFDESFITLKNLDKYKELDSEIDLNKENGNDIQKDFDKINKNFDSFYCLLINKIISHLCGNNKETYVERMKNIYNLSHDQIKFNQEGKKIYQYLMDYNLLENEIFKKILKKPLEQKELEILLYSFRFILNSQMNPNKSFYNDLLKKNPSVFIANNYIPGSFPIINEYIKSYIDLDDKLPKKVKMGYYICKDCGFLYEVEPCTFPMKKAKCDNFHDIGGEDHVLCKKDLRIFLDKKEYEDLKEYWSKCRKDSGPWFDSFIPLTLEEFKNGYVNEYLLKKEKGIIKNIEHTEFEKNIPVRGLNIITYRVLNFILYSYLLAAYVIGNLSEDEVKDYLVENLTARNQNLFEIIKKDWEILNFLLEKYNIKNIKVFMNMIFDKMIEMINNLESLDTEDKFEKFEKDVDQYIIGLITNEAQNLNEKYNSLNSELLSLDPQNIKEIIIGNYDPSNYKEKYPDIQYYTYSNIQNFKTFAEKFNSSEENKKKYSLTYILVNKDLDITKDAKNMKSLESINKLENILLNTYSYKISREDGKNKIFEKEINNIIDKYNEINRSKEIDEKQFKEKYIDPFIENWDIIKSKSVQYKCRILRQPCDMKTEKPLCFFLVDDGDMEGGMFLASAYEHFISWQNKFCDYIISNNKMKGILNSYTSQLEQEIDIQDATGSEIIKITDETYKDLKNLISLSSMRNIFTSDKKINYKNYNDISYNYDFIEEELAKTYLLGIKKFKNDKIKFIIYLYEGFRGENSKVLVDYNEKYIKRDLTEEEKKSLNELIQSDNSSHFYNEVFSSLQILMNEIIKENYTQDYLIYSVIRSLPKYIILNENLKDLFKERYEIMEDKKSFAVNVLVSIFEYFEALCWKDMKNNIPKDYQIILSEESRKYIMDYFERNKDGEKIISKKDFTTALRRLISRYIVSSREESEMKPENKLRLYIAREELWNKNIINNDSFDNEIYEICIDDITIGMCYDLYNLLRGDSLLEKEIYKNKGREGEVDYEIGNNLENSHNEEIYTNDKGNKEENKNKEDSDGEENSYDKSDDEDSRAEEI